MKDIKIILKHTIKETIELFKRDGIYGYLLLLVTINLYLLMSDYIKSFFVMKYIIPAITLPLIMYYMENIIVANRFPKKIYKEELNTMYRVITPIYFIFFACYSMYKILFLPIILVKMQNPEIVTFTLSMIFLILFSSVIEHGYIKKITSIEAYRAAIIFSIKNIITLNILNIVWYISLIYLTFFYESINKNILINILLIISLPIIIIIKGKAFKFMVENNKRKREFYG